MSIIAGISTPIGSGAISIVRLSGEGALELALRFFSSSSLKGEVEPNKMYLGTFSYGEIKDRCMFVYFRAPKSYTGEDMVEFQLHGGVRLTEEVLRALLLNGACMAKEGEFTRRAFLMGKITLDEAEGVMALINAESQAEISSAYSVLKGKVSEKVAPICQKLLDVLSYLEASLDYPEEMEDEVAEVPTVLQDVKESLTALLSTAEKGKLVKNGISVALIGRPNAGKSSLLNAILKEDRAIVTDVAGTTRDTISESVLHNGVRINLLDTAGIRESVDLVEKLGIERSLSCAESADVVVYLLDPTLNDEVDQNVCKKLRGRLIVVNNKSDLAKGKSEYISISAKEGLGIDELLDEIIKDVKDCRAYGDLLTLDRHIDQVSGALDRIKDAIKSIEDGQTVDCTLVDVRAAYKMLGEISGVDATDKVLDQIFSKFCVGK